jgi:hypothetical protein
MFILVDHPGKRENGLMTKSHSHKVAEVLLSDDVLTIFLSCQMLYENDRSHLQCCLSCSSESCLCVAILSQNQVG